MLANTVIAAYRAHPGCEDQLLELLYSHYPTLHRLGLVTDDGAIVLRSPEDSAFVEIFEWSSQEAIRIAHESSEVNSLWAGLHDVADYITLGNLKESGRPFAKFEHVATIHQEASSRAAFVGAA